MKLLDKLKDALFEEEEVEVEEREIKEKPKKEKIKKKKDNAKQNDNSRISKVKITSYEEEEEEKPVAKKIVNEKPIEQEVKEEPPASFSFPMVDDSEFTSENYGLKVTEIEEVKEKKEPKKKKVKKKEEPVLYQSPKDDYVKYAESEYGGYGKGKERKVFKPSPNISPVYGIISDERDYASEIPEREVRLTSALRSDKINIDEVRRKAYGNREDDVEEEKKEEPLEIEESIDLREDAPKVNKVTMGDAEEYFEDLGLEYNNDYIDIKKEKENGKIDDTEINEENTELPAFLQEKTEEKVEIKEDKIEKKELDTETELDDDNLFDLIDSMYDK